MTALVPKKHIFQFGLLLFLVMSLSAGIILATSKGGFTSPKASDQKVVSSPSPTPTATPKLYKK
jgi:hypothetical protein